MLTKFYKKTDLTEYVSDDYKFGTAYEFPDLPIFIDCPSVTQVTTSQMMGGIFTGPAMQNARFRGTTIHYAIEKLLSGETEESVIKFIEEECIEALPFWNSGITSYLKKVEEIYSIEAFTFMEFTQQAKKLPRFDNDLLETFSPFMVRGSYDLHARVGGRRVISDWKTSKARKTRKNIFNYLVQVSMYVLLGQHTYGNESEALDIVMIYPNCEPDVITLEREEMNYYCNIFLRHLYNHYKQFIGSVIQVGDKLSTITPRLFTSN